MGSSSLSLSVLWAGISLALLLTAANARQSRAAAPAAAKVNICHRCRVMMNDVFTCYKKLSIAEQGWTNGHAQHAEDCYLDTERTLQGTPCPRDRIDDSCNCLDGRSGPLCRCSAGETYNLATRGCDEINACVSFPCSTSGGAAICTDTPASAGGRNNTQGRVCTCSNAATQFYANDTAGCIDIVCARTSLPEAPDNATWPATACNDVTVGGACNAACDDGYEGSPTVKCGAGGFWGDVSGTCQRTDLCANVACDAPPNVCTLNTCNPLDGQCTPGNVSCPISPGPSTRVVQISKDNFAAGTGNITLSEKPLNTPNPTYSASNYGATSPNAPTVTFAGYFQGQALSASAGTDCPGGAATGCVAGVPSRPLSLAASPSVPITFITNDGANPTTPVLSGSPRFNGPIAILFSTPVVGFGLDGGFFDAVGGTAITAFDETGQTLLRVANSGLRIEFLGFATDDGSALIKGVLFSLVGAEPAGFAIDNIRFTYGCCE